MSRRPADALLSNLRGRGVQLEVHGDQLRYRPRSATTPDLVEQMSAMKEELIAALEFEGFCASVEATFDAQPCTRSWSTELVVSPDLFGIRTLDDLLDLGTESDPLPERCYACRHKRWWHLAPDGPWFCTRCVPPACDPDRIEYRGLDGDGS